MINEVATVTVTILIYFFVTKTMKRLVSNVLENTYYGYSYKVQLVYNYTTLVRNRLGLIWATSWYMQWDMLCKVIIANTNTNTIFNN